MTTRLGRRTVAIRIRRFRPGREAEPVWEAHEIPFQEGMTVLDGLWKLKETGAPDLAWRASCRMGICGSCGMMINQRPRLACNTQITELGTDIVTVAPLPNFPIIRDLVADLRSMFDAHAGLHPYIIRDDRDELESPTAEFVQSQEQMERYLQFSYCIKCGCCISACPTCATDSIYAGPMPLAQAERYNADSRDDGFAVRRSPLSSEHGPWGCHFAGECSRACPKGVDPAKAIQLLRRSLVLDQFGLRRAHRPAHLASTPSGDRRREGIPKPPAPTV
jgi:succinate dehydrogenase / fumarate reductase iron-sulfur subunit